MKKIIIMAVLCLISASSILIAREDDLKEHELKGKVKSVRVEEADFSDESGEWVERKRRLSKTLEFDLEGELAKMEDYNWHGFRVEKYVRIKSESSFRVERDYYTYFGKPDEKLVRLYDDKGNLQEITIYNVDGSIKETRSYEYDENGRRKHEKGYDGEERLLGRKVYTYDNQGNMIEEVTYKSDGFLLWKNTYAYDEKRNMIEKNSFENKEMFEGSWMLSRDTDLQTKMVYAYDDKGRMIEKGLLSDDGTIHRKWTYTFNESDRMIKWIETDLSSSGILEVSEAKKYDGRGNILEHFSYFGERGRVGLMYLYDYEYDLKYNWIKKIEYQLEAKEDKIYREPQKVQYRAIIYYDDEKTKGENLNNEAQD